MKIKLIGEPRVIMSNPHSNFNYFAWPSAKRLLDGRIAVAASGFRFAHICPFGKCVLSFSNDEGETFSPPTPIIDTVLDDRDAGLCTFGKNGLIVTSFNNSVSQQREWAAGEGHNKGVRNALVKAYLDTVKPEDEARDLGTTYRISQDNGKTFGEILHAPVSSPHGPIELQDGSILWVGRTGNTLGADEKYDRPEKIQAFKIGFNGECEFVGAVEDISGLDSFEPYAIQLPSGKIVCHIRVEPTFSTWQTESYDNGKTWTKPHECLPPYGGTPVHTLLHSSGVLIGAYSYRNLPFGIRVMFSYDEGETWDYGNVIFEHSATEMGAGQDLGYPATVELKDGSLLTVFYARENNDFDAEGGTNPAVIYAQRWSFEE